MAYGNATRRRMRPRYRSRSRSMRTMVPRLPQSLATSLAPSKYFTTTMRFSLWMKNNWSWNTTQDAWWGIPWHADLFPQFQNFAQVFSDYKVKKITYTMKHDWTEAFLAGATEPAGGTNPVYRDASYYVVDTDQQIFPLNIAAPAIGFANDGGGTPTVADMLSYYNCKAAKQSRKISGVIYPRPLILLTNSAGNGTTVNGRQPSPSSWISCSTPNVELSPITYVYVEQNNPVAVPAGQWTELTKVYVDAEMTITFRM